VYVCVRVSEQNSTVQTSTLQYTTRQYEANQSQTDQKERLKTYVLAELSADGSHGLVECRGVHHHLTVRGSTVKRELSLN
jgi:hypothetical protein